MEETIETMLNNAQADSWSDLNDDDDYLFTDDRASPLERLESYIDYCFDTYDIVSSTLQKDQIQACVADWGRRRGQCKYNARMARQEFGKQVREKHRRYSPSNHAVFLSEPLIGVPPEDDKGVGWKACVRHELGHAIDYEQRGTSDHGPKFKEVMSQFGEESNDGGYAHGKAPRRHR